MTVIVVLGVLAIVLATLLRFVRADLRRQEHRQLRRLAVETARRDRLLEDVRWNGCRQEAFEQAMGITIARGDRDLLRELGIEFSADVVPARHLEVVA